MFVVVDHYATKCVGLQPAKKATQVEAVESLWRGVRGNGAGAATGIRNRAGNSTLAHKRNLEGGRNQARMRILQRAQHGPQKRTKSRGFVQSQYCRSEHIAGSTQLYSARSCYAFRSRS